MKKLITITGIAVVILFTNFACASIDSSQAATPAHYTCKSTDTPWGDLQFNTEAKSQNTALAKLAVKCFDQLNRLMARGPNGLSASVGDDIIDVCANLRCNPN